MRTSTIGILTGLLALALLLTLLSGCPRRPATVSPAAPEATVNLWTIWNAEPRQSALAAIVRDFEATHPGVRVRVTAFEPDAYKTSIKVALGGGTPPDIYFAWSGEKMLHSFVRGGKVADLTPALDAEGGEWRRRLIAPSLDRFTFDGRVRGIPYLLQCTFFFYNRALFEQHGWQIPRTWDELISLCEQIRAAGVIPVALGNQQKWPAHHYPFVLTQRLMGQEAAEAQFDPLGAGDYSDPAFVQALSMFSDFARRGFFNRSPNGTTRENARALFYSGQAAMFYTGSWDFSRFVEGGEAPESFWDQWDFFNFPEVPGGHGDQQGLAGSPDGYVVHDDSPVQAQAIEFLKFMTEVDQARSFVTACQELVQVHGAVTEDNAGPILQKYAEIVEEAQNIAPWMDTMMEATVAEEYMNGVQALLARAMTPEQIIEKVRGRQADVKRRMLAEGGSAF